MKTGLVLSGGGLRGIAHLGVLSVLQDNNIPVHAVMGTSAGSIAASSFALAISPKDMLKEIKKLKPSHIYDFPWWTFLLWELYQLLPKIKDQFYSSRSIPVPKGLLTGNKLEKWLTNIFSDIHMNKVSFPLAITATDINTSKLVVFISNGFANINPLYSNWAVFVKKAKLVDVIRASTSVPAIFAPKTVNGQLLVDGGVVNNLPADILRCSLGCQKIIGVDLGQQTGLDKPVSNIFDISTKSIDIMVQATSQITSQVYCDLTLSPEINWVSLEDHHSIDAAYEAGVTATLKSLLDIKQIFN